MKSGIVRFASLYVFNVALLLLIGLLFGRVWVGLHALWAAVVLTLVTLFVKPALASVFRRAVAGSAGRRTRAGEKIVQYALVYAVEIVVWMLTVWLSGVRASGVAAYLLPPLILLVGWVVYDQVDDRLRAKAGELYDSVQARVPGASRPAAASSAPGEGRAAAEGRAELHDGLSAEQRRMLDELG